MRPHPKTFFEGGARVEILKSRVRNQLLRATKKPSWLAQLFPLVLLSRFACLAPSRNPVRKVRVCEPLFFP